MENIENNNIIILENEYFKFYTIDNMIYLNSQSKEMQEKYDSNDVMSSNEKLKRLDLLIEYFYNYWKILEETNNNKLYTMNFHVNLVMFHVPMQYFFKFKKVLESLNEIFKKHLLETYITIDNKLAKYFVDIILNFYKPVKPIHIH